MYIKRKFMELQRTQRVTYWSGRAVTLTYIAYNLYLLHFVQCYVHSYNCIDGSIQHCKR